MARAGSEAIGERDDAVAELAGLFDDERPVEHGEHRRYPVEPFRSQRASPDLFGPTARSLEGQECLSHPYRRHDHNDDEGSDDGLYHEADDDGEQRRPRQVCPAVHPCVVGGFGRVDHLDRAAC